MYDVRILEYSEKMLIKEQPATTTVAITSVAIRAVH